jgi:hypothetical protein
MATLGGSAPPSFVALDSSGAFPCGDGGAICGDATLTSLDPALPHAFRLLFRLGFFELYVDDRLVQTYSYGTYPVTATARVGFVANATGASFVGIDAFQLNLSAWPGS